MLMHRQWVPIPTRTSRFLSVQRASRSARRWPRTCSRRPCGSSSPPAARLFAWDAPFAPYVERAGGLGRASIDTNALVVDVSELSGRAGIGIELRLGPRLVLDGHVAPVHRFNLAHQSRDVAASDPAFV